jgi:hypothetical protein
MSMNNSLGSLDFIERDAQAAPASPDCCVTVFTMDSLVEQPKSAKSRRGGKRTCTKAPSLSNLLDSMTESFRVEEGEKIRVFDEDTCVGTVDSCALHLSASRDVCSSEARPKASSLGRTKSGKLRPMRKKSALLEE